MAAGGEGFKLFTDLFTIFESVTTTFINDISRNAITAIAPFVSTGASLALIVFAILVMKGSISMAIPELTSRIMRYGIIGGIALSSGIYQDLIADTIIDLPDQLHGALLPGAATPESGFGSILDNTADRGITLAKESFDKAEIWSTDSWAFAVIGVGFLIGTILMTVASASLLITSKIILAIMAGFGPIFIAALMFDTTRQYFERWSGAVASNILIFAVYAMVSGLSLKIYEKVLNDISTIDGTNGLIASVGVIIVSLILVKLILKIPALAGALGGGLALGTRGSLSDVGNYARQQMDRGRMGGKAGKKTVGAVSSIAGRGSAYGLAAKEMGSQAIKGYASGSK